MAPGGCGRGVQKAEGAGRVWKRKRAESRGPVMAPRAAVPRCHREGLEEAVGRGGPDHRCKN